VECNINMASQQDHHTMESKELPIATAAELERLPPHWRLLTDLGQKGVNVLLLGSDKGFWALALPNFEHDESKGLMIAHPAVYIVMSRGRDGAPIGPASFDSEQLTEIRKLLAITAFVGLAVGPESPAYAHAAHVCGNQRHNALIIETEASHHEVWVNWLGPRMGDREPLLAVRPYQLSSS
jgi:hypothetical protein